MVPTLSKTQCDPHAAITGGAGKAEAPGAHARLVKSKKSSHGESKQCVQRKTQIATEYKRISEQMARARKHKARKESVSRK